MSCIQQTDGTLKHPEGKGTPQGGVISPVLANIFLDIVFDKWMEKNYVGIPFERYADDIVIHCNNFKQAMRLLETIKERFRDCKLEVNSESRKSSIVAEIKSSTHPSRSIQSEVRFLRVYFPTTNSKRAGQDPLRIYASHEHEEHHPDQQGIIVAQNPSVGTFFDRVELRKLRLRSKIEGWINYYAKFRMSEMRKLFRVLHMRLPNGYATNIVGSGRNIGILPTNIYRVSAKIIRAYLCIGNTKVFVRSVLLRRAV